MPDRPSLPRAQRALRSRALLSLIATGALALVDVSTTAAETERTLQLTYEGPEGCGSAAEVRERLASALGEQPNTPLRASIRLTARGSALELTFAAEARGARSQRTLQLESCEGAVEASVLLLMLTLDPALATESGPEPETPAPDVPAPAEPLAPKPKEVSQPAAEPAAEPAPRQSPPPEPAAGGEKRAAGTRALDAHLGLFGVLTRGFAPGTTVGPHLNVGVSVGLLRLSVGGDWHPQQRTDLAEVAGATVVTRLVRGQAELALVLGEGSLHYGLFVGLGVARLSAEARGVSDPATGASDWLYAPAGLHVGWALSEHWALEGNLSGALALERPAFLVEGLENPAFRPGRAALALAAGFNYRWGKQK